MIRIGIDLDDTLCDFSTPLQEYARKTLSTELFNTFDFNVNWPPDKEGVKELFEEFIFSNNCRDLTPLDNAYSVLRTLKNTGLFEFYIITARDLALTVDTNNWVDEHFPAVFTSVELCHYYGPNKELKRCKTTVCKQLGITIFIDDHPENMICPSIRTIIFDHVLNRTLEGERLTKWSDFLEVLIVFPEKMLIGISGKIGSGKDTIFSLINKHFPRFSNAAFAKRVKETVAAITGTNYLMNCTREGKALIPPGFTDTLGALQQKVGTILRSVIDENIWVNCIINSEMPNYLVITDCRFQNEAKVVDSKGLLIRVNGDILAIREKNEDCRDLNHISETDLDNYTFKNVIENVGTLEELEVKVLKVLIELCRG